MPIIDYNCPSLRFSDVLGSFMLASKLSPDQETEISSLIEELEAVFGGEYKISSVVLPDYDAGEDTILLSWKVAPDSDTLSRLEDAGLEVFANRLPALRAGGLNVTYGLVA